MAHGFVGRNHGKKSQVTPPGIDPGTVRLVAQRLNHYATPGPNNIPYFVKIILIYIAVTHSLYLRNYTYVLILSLLFRFLG